jgi:hypothetical protein
MGSTRERLVAVAIMVCLFAVGMATFLNYFKYRATADRIVKDRLVVIGRSIENSIQASLAVGMSFADLDTLTSLIERERSTDDVILGIHVFDTIGKSLYSTDRMRANRKIPEPWIAAAQRAGDADWAVDHDSEAAVGISIKNNFGLTVGYLAVRYARAEVSRAAHKVGRDLLLVAILIFILTAALTALALLFVMQWLQRDIAAIEVALATVASDTPPEIANAPFGRAIIRLFDSAAGIEANLAAIRRKIERGAAQ